MYLTVDESKSSNNWLSIRGQKQGPLYKCEGHSHNESELYKYVDKRQVSAV